MTTLIYGPPCGGKTELVNQLKVRGDLVLDFDQVHSALSGLDLHDHHDAITPFVLDAIQAITRRLQVQNYDRAWLIAGAPTRAARSELSSFTNENRLVYTDRATCHERAATAGRPDAWHTYIDSWHDAYEPDLPERNDPMPIERRTATEGVELREDGDTLTAVGYAATFNRLSQNLGGFVERVAPGAFTKTVQEADVRALFNHEPDHLLGRSTTGTLRMSEDAHGLRYEIDLPPTTLGRDVAALLRRGDISGSSFGFRTIGDGWSETEDGYPLRTLTEVALRDVGPVTFPAYSSTEASLRSLADERELDLTDLIEAAEANNLRDLIFPTSDEPEPGAPHSVVRHPGTYR
tara:strand:+ start:70 stop:1116 length:1047 start_codon:yes stop_codon:yes gene_type:complete